MIWLFDHTRKFPKHERFRLAKRIDDAIFDVHECLLLAAKSDTPHEYLHEADRHLDKLRAYLRLALELQYTTSKQFQYIASHTTEIGKLLGGWMKKA